VESRTGTGNEGVKRILAKIEGKLY